MDYGIYGTVSAGNLVHRATNLCAKNCDGMVPACTPEEVFNVAALRVQTEGAMKGLELQRSCELAINAMAGEQRHTHTPVPTG